jgi:trehalose 6-phosphate synthase
MSEETDIVLVSNRGPVSFLEKDGEFELKRGAGGLAGALDPVARRLGDDAVWIAAATSDADRHAIRAGATESLPEELGYRVDLLDIDVTTYDRYYNDVSNRMLWFANHCLFDELGIKEFTEDEQAAWQDAYEPVNERFAHAAAQRTRPTSAVLFQDYHLNLAPKFLRQARSGQTIFHFTHSSFSEPDCLWQLPEPLPQRIVHGMLGADLLGFHVRPWARNFLACCERAGATVDLERGLVRNDDRSTWVRTYPIPIDPRELRERSRGDPARRWADRFRSQTTGPLLVRADRAEPSKNVVRGFRAFGLLLDRRPDLRGKARFVACLYPSRGSMDEYQRYSDEIKATVDEINDRHPGAVELFFKDDFDRTIGAMMVYDALIVNSIMDGMNLVSKEGPTVNGSDGVVILSRGAGSFDELGDDSVEITDPYDVEETARAIEQAFEMPTADRRRRAAGLRAKVSATTPDDWIEAQLTDLRAIRRGAPPESPPPA